MKILSLITEYNPFHNGHIYHINTAKKLVNPDVTIAIMSGNYTQRGELAVTNKFVRANAAIQQVDLVIELPLLYATSFADDFAFGGVSVAKALRTTDIVFGSETNDIKVLTDAYNKSKKITKSELSPLLKKGYSYPRAIEALTGASVFSSPNNTLGMSYIKAADTLKYKVNMHAIKRIGNDYNDSNLSTTNFSSATSLRETLLNGDIDSASLFMPKTLAEDIVSNHVVTNEKMFQSLKIIIERSTPEELSLIYTMTEGLEYRLKNEIVNAATYDDFLNRIKTKRYTRTRLQRLLIYVLLNIKTTDVKNYKTNAYRVLAMNKTGQAYLKSLNDPRFITNVTKKDSSNFYYEIKGTRIYNTLTNQTLNDFNQPVIIHSP